MTKWARKESMREIYVHYYFSKFLHNELYYYLNKSFLRKPHFIIVDKKNFKIFDMI